MQSFLAQYPLSRALTLVVKYYLKQNFLNDTWSGGIGSYTLVILVVSYLQNHTKSGGLGDDDNLADLLIGFFDFYGRKFNYTENGISVKDKCYFNKKLKRWFNDRLPYSLSVEDPHNPEIDVGSASFEILKAKRSFKDAYYRLTETIKYQCKSYLAQSDVVRAPFVSLFRDHIKKTYSDESLNKKRYPYHPKSLLKDPKSKYPVRSNKSTYKVSRSNPPTGENHTAYYRAIVDTTNSPQTTTQQTTNTETSISKTTTTTTSYAARKFNNPTRCWNKPLDLQTKKPPGLSVNN